jgi:hypothetical protein
MAEDDPLAPLSLQQVAGFYSRLADGVDARKGKLAVSLAATLMRLWLTNRTKGAELTLEAPAHLRDHEQTKATLRYHRQVFLTEQKARLGQREAWAGVMPRLQGKAPYQTWDLKRPLQLEYESLTEFPLRYQLTGNDADRDLLYSLHGFQLHSNVTVNGTILPASSGARPQRKVRITFQSFTANAHDVYDWNYSEHLKVPNPDFGSTAQGAVSPKSKTVIVYHKHAKRIEDAGLAAPYRFRTTPWSVLDAAIVAPAEVDPTRLL